MQQPVTILLATYNGEKYINEQIRSIINQTHKNWRLFIRDDASTDNTLAIVKQIVKQNKDRIFLVEDKPGNLGSAQNFNALMPYANNADYIMYCDQDDVWMQNKIEITLNKMIELENQHRKSTPLLVYTNFTYVDDNLDIIPSKKRFSATRLNQLKFSHIITQNPAYGCTMMLNNALLKTIAKIPTEAENHDYWTSLVASAFGRIFYLPVSTILYRQHGKNISGSHDNNHFVKRFKRIFINKMNVKDADNKIKMAIVFREKYNDLLDKKTMQIINDFILLQKKKSLSLIIKNLKNGLRRQTFMQTSLFYISIILTKTKRVN